MPFLLNLVSIPSASLIVSVRVIELSNKLWFKTADTILEYNSTGPALILPSLFNVTRCKASITRLPSLAILLLRQCKATLE